MTVWAVDGAAGYGKTHCLIEMMSKAQIAAPLQPGQRILAVTYMRGSRLRLDARLRQLPELRGRYTCTTVDSMVLRLRDRWRTLGRELGLPALRRYEGKIAFDDECERAGMLLEQEGVGKWLAASFPIVLLDEGQDLVPARLRIFQALAKWLSLYVALDDFQCLNPEFRPSPLAQWLPSVCTVETMASPQRTDVAALLEASWAIRNGQSPKSGVDFLIQPTPQAPLAAAWLAGQIARHPKGSIAILTPSAKGQGAFARQVVTIVSTKPCGAGKKLGPYPIRWEFSEGAEADDLVTALTLQDSSSIAEAIAAVAALPGHTGALKQTISWIRRQADIRGLSTLARSEVEACLRRQLRNVRTVSGSSTRLVAMNVHQAKNREFAGVVVIWPHAVGGDDEAKRRLLYNAITRARRWCTVLVQDAKMLRSAPFAPTTVL